MGTAERSEAPAGGAVGHPSLTEDGLAGDGLGDDGEREFAFADDSDEGDDEQAFVTDDDPGEREAYARRAPLWVEEPARRRRLPDPVRTAAVRAVLLIAVTLVQAVTAFLCTLAGSWLAFPMVLSSVVSTVLATWGVLDVWVTRQVWNQRHGVVSTPSAAARALRRERRRVRRRERSDARAQERIRRRGGAGQLSHP
ncbi:MULTISPECIES: hypothetical protein [unclassified Streptomyces]|uniref:hypothetical protein n=1 Tax=unclassified Streptomyces TaxID=2593676 RepID=UPI0004BF002D|nr:MULTISPECIES: hypothetical protein [unclassified Streptomyces]